MQTFKRYLTYAILVTFPIMSIVSFGESFKFNMALSDALIVILGLVWLIDIKKFSLKKNYPYIWYFIGLIVILFISNIYNMKSGIMSGGMNSLISELIKFVISAVYLFVGYNSFKEKSEIRNIGIAWIIGLWIFVIYGLLIFSGFENLRFNQVMMTKRFLGTITDSNAAALYLTVSFFLIIWLFKFVFKEKITKMILLISAFFTILCLMLTLSRGGIIGFVGGVGLYVVINLKKLSEKVKFIPFVFMIIVGLLWIDIGLLNGEFTKELLNRTIDITREGGMLDVRLNLAQAAVNMGIDNPIIGVGRGNYAFNSPPYLLEAGADLATQGQLYINMVAHNTLAGIFAELGIIGLLLFVSIYVIMLFKLIKSNEISYNAKIIWLCMWTAVFIESMSICAENTRFIWIILGINLTLLDNQIIFEEKIELEMHISRKKNNLVPLIVISLVAILFMYIDISFKFSYGNIELSNKNIEYDFIATEDGDYRLRYYINNYNSLGNKASVRLENVETGEVKEYSYGQVGNYANIDFKALKSQSYKIFFSGAEKTLLNDIKIISKNKTIVLSDTYPLIGTGFFERMNKYGIFKSIEKRQQKNYGIQGILNENEYVNLGDKILYKGLEITKNELGQTQFKFTFECIEKMEYDYVLWMHLNSDDLNVSENIQLQGYLNCDHFLEIPTSQWMAGNEYTDVYTIDLNKGEYTCNFGFWLYRGTEMPELRLWNKQSVEVEYGWFNID